MKTFFRDNTYTQEDVACLDPTIANGSCTVNLSKSVTDTFDTVEGQMLFDLLAAGIRTDYVGSVVANNLPSLLQSVQ